MNQKAGPTGHPGSRTRRHGARRQDLDVPKGGQPYRLDEHFEGLLSSRAVPNHVAGEASMPDTDADPAGIALSETASAATELPGDPFARRRAEAKAALLASAPRPGAAEAILYDVASRELAIYVELSEAQEKLARELHEAVTGDVRGALALGKVLREVTQVAGAIGRRVEHVLTTATSLRAQRRFLELQGGRDKS
jgi:hypothetical protein